MVNPREPSVAPDLETTEFRVFAAEPLPAEVARWIDDWPAAVERRRDVYVVDGREDVGVKRRGGTTLELKVRSTVDARMEFGGGLVGRPEVWRKWSPADGIVEPSETAGLLVDVDKEIVRRRFELDGGESVYSADSIPDWPGCDVEFVRVGVGATTGWTFALTAFGPPATRLEALRVAWSAVAAPEPVHRLLRDCRPMGYPEWLTLAMWDQPTEPTGGPGLAD